LITEMSNLQRISDSMASDAMQREIKHQKASDIQRRSFQKGVKLKHELQSKQHQLEQQLEYDDGIIDELETEIADMLVVINGYKVRLKLPTFDIFVPIKDAKRKAKKSGEDSRRKTQSLPLKIKTGNKENEQAKMDIINATSPTILRSQSLISILE